MITVLSAAVAILAVVVTLNLLLTFSLIRRWRTTSGPADPAAYRPSAGALVRPFRATMLDGAPFSEADLRHGRHTLVFLLPNCGGCTSLVEEIRSAVVPGLVVVISGAGGDPAVQEILAELPETTRVVLSPLGDAASEGFQVSTYPTVLEVADGTIVRVGASLLPAAHLVDAA
ncbi:hypothetical protein AB0M47_03615 [Hamadaea sp. NPDC051192]|uniref:hypothetical protein n=1 Tax=Hamadaea sp. NPDC051192 TaxID=3154940 RepID=UPI00343F91A3